MMSRRSSWAAVPLRPDGTERPGTLGTLTGEYVSRDNFCRFRIGRDGEAGVRYAVYKRGAGWDGRWLPVGDACTDDWRD
jgi:hypothetical protein